MQNVFGTSQDANKTSVFAKFRPRALWYENYRQRRSSSTSCSRVAQLVAMRMTVLPSAVCSQNPISTLSESSFSCFSFQGNENLICRGFKGQGISFVNQGFSDFVRGFNGQFPDLVIQVICKQRLELNPGAPSLHQQRAMLFHDGKEKRHGVFLWKDDRFTSFIGSIEIPPCAWDGVLYSRFC